jgi:hypothetical protein
MDLAKPFATLNEKVPEDGSRLPSPCVKATLVEAMPNRNTAIPNSWHISTQVVRVKYRLQDCRKHHHVSLKD